MQACRNFNQCMMDWLEYALKPNMTKDSTLITNFLLARDVGDIPRAMWSPLKILRTKKQTRL